MRKNNTLIFTKDISRICVYIALIQPGLGILEPFFSTSYYFYCFFHFTRDIIDIRLCYHDYTVDLILASFVCIENGSQDHRDLFKDHYCL